MSRRAGQTIPRGEAGFTLPEVLVTMMLMMVVLFALYSIFDMSIRVFSFGNNKVEAVENARLGLEKMEREIRAAYPYNKGGAGGVTPDGHLFDTMSATEIAFGNNLDSDYVVSSAETIRYRLEDSDPGDGETVCNTGETCRVTRSKGGADFQPVVEFVGGPSGLGFTYLKPDGPDAGTDMDPTTNSADEPLIKAVRVTLNVRVAQGTRDEGTQTVATNIILRNRR